MPRNTTRSIAAAVDPETASLAELEAAIVELAQEVLESKRRAARLEREWARRRIAMRDVTGTSGWLHHGQPYEGRARLPE